MLKKKKKIQRKEERKRLSYQSGLLLLGELSHVPVDVRLVHDRLVWRDVTFEESEQLVDVLFVYALADLKVKSVDYKKTNKQTQI